MWTLCEPDEDSRDANESRESPCEFVVARSDAAKLLNSGEETLDEISTFVIMDIVTAGLFSINTGWNDGFGTQCSNGLEKRCSIESFIGDDALNGLHVGEEILCFSDVMPLLPREDEPAQDAQAIDRSMNLGAQSPTRTAKTLLSFFYAPAACWWARTIVLSRKTSSKSASSDKRAKRVCHSPLSDQREKRLNTVFHGPNAGGRSRHGAPVRAINSTASTNSRLSAPVRPRSPGLAWSNPSIRAHWSSRCSNLGIRSSSQKTGCKHNSDTVNSR